MKTSQSITESGNAQKGRSAPFFNSHAESGSAFFGADPSFFPIIQPKLSIGRPGDRYEQEADFMADQVVNRLAANEGAPGVQSKCAGCAEDDAQMKQDPLTPGLQRAMEDEEELQMKQGPLSPRLQRAMDPLSPRLQRAMDPLSPRLQRAMEEEEMQMKPEVPGLMRMADGDQAEAGPELAEQLSASNDGGQSLPAGTLNEMNQAFGADFSRVKVHNDSSAVQMSKDIGAQAFTHGANIYFNQGKYSPDSAQGKSLLAHELTHTIQQGAVDQDI